MLANEGPIGDPMATPLTCLYAFLPNLKRLLNRMSSSDLEMKSLMMDGCFRGDDLNSHVNAPESGDDFNLIRCWEMKGWNYR